MEIKNVSGIDFEDCRNEEWIKDLRCPNRDPLDFNQPLIQKHLGDLLQRKNLKVLEIGCGWGRNAQFFKSMDNVDYYAFDASPTSRAYFVKEEFPKDRFYISDSIDERIMSNEYDFIFSTYVLQHIGWPTAEELKQFSALYIIDKLLPQLKTDGVMLFHELRTGQNDWSVETFCAYLTTKSLNVVDEGAVVLSGGDKDSHNLIIARK